MTNSLRLALGVACCASLAGCNKAEPASANDVAVVANVAEPVTNTAAPAAPVEAAAGGDALSTAFMTGKWSAMAEDCTDTVEFRKDGTLVTPIGNGKWALDGDKLNADFGDGNKQAPSSIKALSHDRIEVTRADGKVEHQKRC